MQASLFYPIFTRKSFHGSINILLGKGERIGSNQTEETPQVNKSFVLLCLPISCPERKGHKQWLMMIKKESSTANIIVIKSQPLKLTSRHRCSNSLFLTWHPYCEEVSVVPTTTSRRTRRRQRRGQER